MEDFAGKEIIVGATVFFMHTLSEPVLGRVTEISSKKLFTVSYSDVIKLGKRGQQQIDKWKKANPNVDLSLQSYVVNCDKAVIVEY